MFVDPDPFLAMVRDRHPPVYRHRSVQFGGFAKLGHEASLSETMVENDNVVWAALYSLRRLDERATGPFQAASS
jgi:hypothetical protein